MAQEVRNLEELLDRIGKAANSGDRVKLDSMVEEIGRRSFGPLLLMAGVVLASPVSGIPGVPTAMGLLVLLIAAQLLIRRRTLWLPGWLLRRSVPRKKLEKALQWLRPPARFIDRWLRPRLTIFVRRSSEYIIAGVCVVIGVGVPVMELVPFSATLAGVALAIFGLAIVACDGLLALIAFTLTALTFGLVLYNMA